MRIAALLTVLAVSLASPSFAIGFGSRLNVTQDNATDFTVQFRSGAALTDFWCAAGNFVSNTLRRPSSTRVFRLSPPPRGSGQGIRFTLDASRSAGDTGISTFGGPQDGSMSAGGAVAQFCVNQRLDRN